MNTPSVRLRSAGFTLTEVLVAVPLLVLVFWIVGQIFVTTQGTVELGMIHSKVTASAESAVQRMARDLAGLRTDGRLVVVAARTADQPLNRENLKTTFNVTGTPPELPAQVPGCTGILGFISQGTWQSQAQGGARGNLARILYRPALRRDSAGNTVTFWDAQAMTREIKIYSYNPLAIRTPAQTEVPQALPAGTDFFNADVIGWPSTQVSVNVTTGTATVLQPRTDLMRAAVESFRTSVYVQPNGALTATVRSENILDPAQAANPGVFPFGTGWNPAFYPHPINALDTQRFFNRLMLTRCALVYNGLLAPPVGSVNAAGKFPDGVLAGNPSPDPGAAAMFQWWGNQAGAINWYPNAAEIPVAPGGYYHRRFMFVKDVSDVAELTGVAQPGYPATFTVGGSVNVNQFRCPNPPASTGIAPQAWPDALRINFHIFDKSGRFRRGALFQAVVDVPSNR